MNKINKFCLKYNTVFFISLLISATIIGFSFFDLLPSIYLYISLSILGISLIGISHAAVGLEDQEKRKEHEIDEIGENS